MKALVWRGPGTQLSVEDIEPVEPGEDEVLVKVKAAGICHSDLSMVDGTLAAPHPLILGHEAAGVVAETGQHVVLNWAPPCRRCWFCERGEPWLCAALGAPAKPRPGGWHVTLGLGALAEEVVVPKNAIIPVPREVPFEHAALLGCAVLTGTGAVRRTAQVRAGESVVVIGLGGVGLAAVMAAKAAGASPIIAVDQSDAKEQLAWQTGATHFALSDDSLSKVVRQLTEGRGADHAFECVGKPATIRAAWRAARRGGNVIVVGIGAKADSVEFSPLDIFHSSRVLRSSVLGSSDPDRDLPLLATESLSIGRLITDTVTLDEAPQAFARMARGEGARTVVVFESIRRPDS